MSKERFQWSAWWLFLCFVGILMIELFPYNFFIWETLQQLTIPYLWNRFQQADSFNFETILNFFVFLIFGFCLTGWRQPRNSANESILPFVISVSFSVSLLLELLQLFLPDRYPSYFDLLIHSSGGIVGWLCFLSFGQLLTSFLTTLRERLKKFFSYQILVFALLSYVTLALFASIELQRATNQLWQVSNWSADLPLILGNELTGNRPWDGQISSLCLTNYAMSPAEVGQLLKSQDNCGSSKDTYTAGYRLNHYQDSFRDQFGHLPELVWHGNGPSQQEINGVTVNADYWLQTEDSVENWIQAVKQTKAFTLATTLRSEAEEQYGPARVISISEDAFHRNLTLGQEGDHFRLRLRTPLTGVNGKHPEFAIANVFQAFTSRQIVITFDGSLLNIFVDSLEHVHTIKFTPGATLFWLLSPSSDSFRSTIHPSLMNTKFYNFIFYSLIFVPFTFMLILTLNRFQGQHLLQLLLITSSVIIPATILEGLLSYEANRSFMLENVLLCVGICAGILGLHKITNLAKTYS